MEKSWHSLSMHYLRRCVYIYMCARTYKRIKKIMRNSARLNRNRSKLKDRQKVDYLLRDKWKNAIMSDYVQNGPLKQLFRVRIKILRSRRSIFPFNLLFGTCFCCVCSLFTCVCVLLSVLCSAFNLFLFRLRKFFI